MSSLLIKGENKMDAVSETKEAKVTIEREGGTIIGKGRMVKCDLSAERLSIESNMEEQNESKNNY